MSTELESTSILPTGFPELTELGKRIEVLRIERGLSKQHLARHAGTSRQQLWRVMTGKSELTSSLRVRLADVLRVEVGLLASGSITWNSHAPQTVSLADSAPIAPQAAPVSFATYLSDSTRLEQSMRSLPTGDEGRRLKRTLLNAIEDLAVEQGTALNAGFFDLRRRVLAADL